MSTEAMPRTAGLGSVAPRPTRRVVGVNLKMYFGVEHTYRWLEKVAALCADLTVGSQARLDLFVLPSYPMLGRAVEILEGTGIAVGAQNVAADDWGAHSGEVPAAMLSELGCARVLIGHAERRAQFSEDDGVVARKVRKAVRYGLVPVVCVGEHQQTTFHSAYGQCSQQLSAIAESAAGAEIIVAYEPIWAIGAREPAPTDHVVAMCQALRESAAGSLDRATFLYGGAAGTNLFGALEPAVHGLFLGRFAHDPQRFRDIAEQIADASPTFQASPTRMRRVGQ